MMTADKPSPFVPKLRFPEFEGAGDWEEKRLSSLVKLVSGVHLAPDTYSTTGEVPYFTGPSDFTDAIQCVAKWTAESVNIAKQHDTLITVKGSGVGQIWYLTLPSIAMGRQLMAVRTEVGDRRFIYQFLSTRRAQFGALASGNLIPGLSRGDILGMAAYFPSRDEQQKIADCLGSLDDLIAADGRNLEGLREHKQGLMQQLFPQPTETVTRLPFPEFLNGSKWDELTIGDVCDLKAGDFIPASEIAEHAHEGSFPCYGGNGLRGYVKSFTHEGRYVLVGRQGALCGNVNLYAGEFHATEHALVATPKPGINTGWLFYALDVLKLNRFAIGQAQPGLSVAVLRGVGISVPVGKDEQQKIADCLGSLDNLIAAEGRKLETLRQHKQGLMQQLFPSLEAG